MEAASVNLTGVARLVVTLPMTDAGDCVAL